MMSLFSSSQGDIEMNKRTEEELQANKRVVTGCVNGYRGGRCGFYRYGRKREMNEEQERYLDSLLKDMFEDSKQEQLFDETKHGEENDKNILDEFWGHSKHTTNQKK